MVNDRLGRLKALAIDETRKLFQVFLYIWILLSLFSIHKALIFNEDILTYQLGCKRCLRHIADVLAGLIATRCRNGLQIGGAALCNALEQ